MSDLDNVAPGGVVNLNDVPGGLDDSTFDSLFPADGKSTAVAPIQQQDTTSGQPTNGQTAPATTPSANDFFLKGDKSVYKTQEDAAKGINEKDALIDVLRQRYALTTGIDPITGQPVQAAQVQQAQVSDYSNNPDLYMEDLYKAAKTSSSAYRDVQQKLVMDTLKPLQPLVQKMAREQAVESVATEISGIDKFIGSPVYQKALDANPELKNAIATAETDSRFYSRLGGLYKLTYLTAQGMQLPDLLRAQQAAPAVQPNQQTPAPPARPTTAQPTTPSAARETAAPNFKSIEGIKAVIAAQEAKGQKLDF